MNCFTRKLFASVDNPDLPIFDEVVPLYSVTNAFDGQYINLDGLMLPTPKFGQLSFEVHFTKNSKNGTNFFVQFRNGVLSPTLNYEGKLSAPGITTNPMISEGDHVIKIDNTTGVTSFDGQEYQFSIKQGTSSSNSVLCVWGIGGDTESSASSSLVAGVTSIKKIVINHNGTIHTLLPMKIGGRACLRDELTHIAYYANSGELIGLVE